MTKQPSRAPRRPSAGRPLHENPWFRVFNRDGYYTVEQTHPQVAVMPVVTDDFVMVRVHRPVVGAVMLEFPAGSQEPGEDARQAACRELAEETGIVVTPNDRFEELPGLSICPDRHPTWPRLFRVRVSEEEYAARHPHDDEIVEVCRFSVRAIFQRLGRGELVACLPLAMLFRELGGAAFSGVE